MNVSDNNLDNENLKRENQNLRRAIHALLNVTAINGSPIPVKKVQEAVLFAKKALKNKPLPEYKNFKS